MKPQSIFVANGHVRARSRPMQVWKASLLLGDWLLHHASLLPSPFEHVLELGAGTALPSIVAASLGCHAIATDADMDALTLARRNVSANVAAIADAGGSVSVARLDWHEFNHHCRLQASSDGPSSDVDNGSIPFANWTECTSSQVRA